MSPTRLEWLLQLSIRQMQEARREGYAAEDRGHTRRACPYAENTARRFAWLEGYKSSERHRLPAED